MASPQTEKGYTRLANELAQAIYRFPFSGQELRVVIWVLRHSYGWQRRDTAPTSVRALAKEICLPEATARWAVGGLGARGILMRMIAGGGFRLNKNYDEWLERRPGQLALVANTAAKRRAPADAPASKKRKGSQEPEGFKPPTLAQVKEYCAKRSSPVDPEKFWHHYEANGWRSGRNPVTNWKSSVCYWERTSYASAKGAAATGATCPLCDENQLPNANAVVCDKCGPRCRTCQKDTARLKIVTRRDKTKTAVCADGCSNADDQLAAAAVPGATRELDAARTERFMSAHRRRGAAKEKNT